MAIKLFVGGLSWGTTQDQLKQHFSQVGEVVSATVMTDKFSGKSRGFGFVEMSSDAEAQEAVSKFNGSELDGRTLVVNEARPLEPRNSSFGPNRSGFAPSGGRPGFNRGFSDNRGFRSSRPSGNRGGFRGNRGGDR